MVLWFDSVGFAVMYAAMAASSFLLTGRKRGQWAASLVLVFSAWAFCAHSVFCALNPAYPYPVEAFPTWSVCVLGALSLIPLLRRRSGSPWPFIVLQCTGLAVLMWWMGTRFWLPHADRWWYLMPGVVISVVAGTGCVALVKCRHLAPAPPSAAEGKTYP